MKSSFASLFSQLTLAATVASTLAGCDEPQYPTPTPVSTSAVGQARVLVVNAAPGSTGVTATLENQAFGVVTPYLGFPVSTYTSVSAGQRLFVFNDQANAPGPEGPRPVILRSSFLGGTDYTVFLTDPPTRPLAVPVTATSDRGGIRTLVLTDNLAPPAVATNAKIRFVNLAPTAAGGNTNYGIYNSVTQAALFSAVPIRGYRLLTNTSTAMPPVTTNFANFTEIAAGTYTLDVRSVAATALAGTQQSITLVAGKIYTLYTRGVLGSTTTPLGISVVTHN
jgi:hypothetical protein